MQLELLFLLIWVEDGEAKSRGAFSYLQNIVSNHQLEFGGQWQLRYVINSELGGRKVKGKKNKNKNKARQRMKRDNRIVGGFEVTDNSWQFMVDIGGLCGGSLISNQFVLTAAHCCEKASFDFSVIRLGIKDFKDTVNTVNRVAEQKVVHPLYDELNFKHDICLVLLNETVTFSERIQPISLPIENENLFDQDEEEDSSTTHVFVAGWGTVGELHSKPINELFPTQLLNAMVPFVPNETCSSQDFYGSLVDTEFVFCAGNEQADTCQYDSGGPAVVLKKRNSRYEDYVPILAGITSWGEGCARENRPGVYTRVQKYISWIETEQRLMDLNETSCSGMDRLIDNEESAAQIEHTCSKLDQRCWFHCREGFVPSVISIRCRNERNWVTVNGSSPKRKTIKCEPAQTPTTACGEMDGVASNGRDFTFNSTAVEARCNTSQECLFYCKDTMKRASGMFYTRCKTQSYDQTGNPSKSRWKPRPRITQEPHC